MWVLGKTMLKLDKLWSIWCKTLGTRISECDKESDFACFWRTTWVLVNMVTCIFIIAGVIRHW